MNASEAVSQRIRQLARERKISIAELERRSGRGSGAFNSIMTCKNKSIDVKTILLVTNALDISLEQFFDSPLFNYKNLDVD